jgi:hypothetical protein
MALSSSIRLLLLAAAMLIAVATAKHAKTHTKTSKHVRGGVSDRHNKHANGANNHVRPDDEQEYRGPDKGEMPERHKNIGAFHLGKPVKYTNSQDSVSPYVLLTKYGESNCGGDASQISSIQMGVCYEMTFQYIYTDDDQYSYNFYGYDYYGYYYGYSFDDYYFLEEDEGQQSQTHSQSKAAAAHGKSLPKTRARNVPHKDVSTAEIASVRSLEYSVDSVVVSGVTQYVLYTTLYWAHQCTGHSITYNQTVSSTCQDTSIASSTGDHAMVAEPEIFDDLFDDYFGNWTLDDQYIYDYYYDYYYYGYYYFNPLGVDSSQIYTLSDSQFVTPDTPGVTTGK